ncbi:MAG: ABC transporter permease [SAR202 cluster bacterium]|nr:ABC transporter permease [SAR202 cluster bacterium]RZP15540.1 MAG: ABC transporter permease [Chloroflexota bacterium]|tara:strand:+ start:750 stop:1679 length:930 start_codon:yes stop_codon:yes gene_type:complete
MTLSTKIGIDEPSWIEKNVPGYVKFKRYLSLLQRWPVIPIFFISILVLLAVFADVTGYDPELPALRDRTLPMFSEPVDPLTKDLTRHWLGADQFGRDTLTRIMHGARITLYVLLISAVSGTIIGTAYGLIAGYFGGFVDDILMRILDLVYSIPFLLLALVAAIVFDPSLTVVIVLLAFLAWPAFVRNVRAEILTLKERDYIMYARVAGASRIRMMYKHLLPGVINTVIVIATLRIGQLILAEASLSFLGAGVPPPTPVWGALVAEGRDYLNSAWWVSIWPSLGIFLVVMSLNFLGDWFRDKFDPRLRQL